MPGFEIEDDELQKLFAEAGNAVKKAAHPTPAAAPKPAPAAAEVERAEAQPEPPARPAVSPLPAPATAPTGAPVRLMGGEQAADAFVGNTGSAAVRVPWSQMRALTVGRVGERQILAFLHGSTPYYFSDDNVAYKGLLKTMNSVTAMNWRGLVNEMASQVADKSDAGVQAVMGSGGMVPRYPDMQALLVAMAGRR